MIQSKLKYLNQKILPQKIFFAPEWIVLGVNNTCNLHCKMCDVGVDYQDSNFYQNLVGTKPLHMPLDLFKKIADQTAAFFPSTKLGFAFTEPLVYLHLYESLKYASEKKLFTSITTNALSLKKWADKLIDAQVNEINVSLDGPADVHNEIRGYVKSFEKAVEGIDYILSQKTPPKISIFCVITEWNIGRLKELTDFFKNYPISSFGFMHTNFTPEYLAEVHNQQFGSVYHATASNMKDIQIEKYNFEMLYNEIEIIKKTNYPYKVSFSPELNNLEKIQTFYSNPETFFGKMCFDIFRAMMVKSNGDVIPAHGRCYNLNIGNVYENNIKEIWNSSIVSKFRHDVNKAGGFLPACSRCCSAFSK